MNRETIQKFLELASESYYKGTPLIPDEVYDRLEKLTEPVVGYSGEKSPHLYQLYSLEKFYEGETEPNRVFKNPISSPKLDGANLAIVFADTKVVSALTRGDGVCGNDITDKFLGRKFPFPGVYQVVYEVVASKELPNSRNYAAGALNLKDLAEFQSRNLEYFVHSVNPSITGYYQQDMKLLEINNIKTVLGNHNFDLYPQDGVVVRENNEKDFEQCGYTNHHPRGAYAVKKQKEGVPTVLNSIEWQVGKSGKVTPVGNFTPINIDGAVISKASLHNIAFIEALGLDIGDEILVIRSGDIIPYVLGKVSQ